MRNALAVVGAVDIHLAAAIGAIEQAREGSCFAPAVRVASDIPTDFLHKVKGLLGAAITLHAIYNPLIAEEITEYLLPESCFLAALKFFEKFFVLGESFFDFLYLYK